MCNTKQQRQLQKKNKLIAKGARISEKHLKGTPWNIISELKYKNSLSSQTFNKLLKT